MSLGTATSDLPFKTTIIMYNIMGKRKTHEKKVENNVFKNKKETSPNIVACACGQLITKTFLQGLSL